MGLDVYLYDGKERVEETPSVQHPDHLWNQGYLRSSYNGSGFNSVVRNLVKMDLYSVFQPGDAYDFAIKRKLPQIRENAEKLRRLLQEQECGLFVSAHTPTNMFETALPEVDEARALDIVREQMARSVPSWVQEGEANWYGNGQGDFYFGKPLEVVAMVRGKDAFGTPTIHVVSKGDLTWYTAAADVLLEFIANAEARDNPRLHWSS